MPRLSLCVLTLTALFVVEVPMNGRVVPIEAPLAPRVDPAAADDIDALMGTIKKTLEDLMAKIEDGTQRTTVLDGFARLQTAILSAKGMVPPKTEKVKENEREAFVADYRKLQIDVLKLTLDAEKKYLEGKTKDAKKLLREIEASKGKGHGKFKE